MKKYLKFIIPVMFVLIVITIIGILKLNNNKTKQLKYDIKISYQTNPKIVPLSGVANFNYCLIDLKKRTSNHITESYIFSSKEPKNRTQNELKLTESDVNDIIKIINMDSNIDIETTKDKPYYKIEYNGKTTYLTTESVPELSKLFK